MGIEIKIARIRKGITQEELARSAGITRYYLSSLENGKAKNPSVELMKKIAKKLEMTVGELFFDEN